MTVSQLNREQINELKAIYIAALLENDNTRAYANEIADTPEIVSDEAIFKRFKDITFEPSDFQCTVGGC